MSPGATEEAYTNDNKVHYDDQKKYQHCNISQPCTGADTIQARYVWGWHKLFGLSTPELSGRATRPD